MTDSCLQVREIHPEHVVLKKLAIGCKDLAGDDVDIVFASDAEYGALPRSLAPKFKNNPAAQNAARMLKVAFKHSAVHAPPPDIPSFMLETLVLEAQSSGGDAATVHADGSMQLFCDTLQLLVDAPQVGNWSIWYALSPPTSTLIRGPSHIVVFVQVSADDGALPAPPSR